MRNLEPLTTFKMKAEVINRCVPADWARALWEDTVGLLFVTICQQGVTALTCEATEGDLICFEMNYKYSAAILSYPSWCRGCGQGCSLSLRAVIDGNHVFSYQSRVEGRACCGGQRAASSGAYPALTGLGPLDVTVLVFKWIVNFWSFVVKFGQDPFSQRAYGAKRYREVK